jgi:hypothetical protein
LPIVGFDQSGSSFRHDLTSIDADVNDPLWSTAGGSEGDIWYKTADAPGQYERLALPEPDIRRRGLARC